MPKSINQIQDEILQEFDLFDDWSQKYQHIIDMGTTLPMIDPQYRDDDHLIKGCQSDVWLRAEKIETVLHFTADSDAAITKGIIAMLVRIFNDHTPQEIINADLYILEKLDLQSHLSPNRANGLLQMIKKIRSYAESNI